MNTLRRATAPVTVAEAALFNSLPLHRAEWLWLCLWTCQHAGDVERMTWADTALLNGRGPSTMVIRNTKNGYTEGLRVRMPKPLERVLAAKAGREHPRPELPIVQRWPSRKTTLPRHCRRLGLPEVNATGLRHTGASWIVRRMGITPAVCRYLGHTSPVMAARVYAHALPAQLGDVVEAMESIEHEGWNDNAIAPDVAAALEQLVLDDPENDNGGGGGHQK